MGGNTTAVGDDGVAISGGGSGGAGAATGGISGAVLNNLPRPRFRELEKGAGS